MDSLPERNFFLEQRVYDTRRLSRRKLYTFSIPWRHALSFYNKLLYEGARNDD